MSQDDVLGFVGHLAAEEAGRRGGKATATRHGREHYREIGRKGGRTLLAKYGTQHFAALSQLMRDGRCATLGLAVVVRRRQDRQRLGTGTVVHVHADGTVNLEVSWDHDSRPSLLAGVAHATQPKQLQHPWFDWIKLKVVAPRGKHRRRQRVVPEPVVLVEPELDPEPLEVAVLKTIEEIWTANGGLPFDWIEITLRLNMGVSAIYPAAEVLRQAGVIAYEKAGIVLLVPITSST